MKKYMMILLAAFMMTACKPNQQIKECVDEIVAFVQIQKDSCKTYSDEEWEIANTQFVELLFKAKKYEDDMKLDQKWRLGKASTEFVLLQLNRDPEKIQSEILKGLNTNPYK